MTLNKKYCALIDSDSGYDNQLLADCCENIADEFAIGFAEWIDSDFYQGDDVNEYHKSIIEYREGKIFTIKELLEIYKK
jgi:hypothetical protein